VFREDLLNRLRRNTLIQGDNPQDDRDLTKPVSGQHSHWVANWIVVPHEYFTPPPSSSFAQLLIKHIYVHCHSQFAQFIVHMTMPFDYTQCRMWLVFNFFDIS
jgi:hypothetical protein